MAGLFGSRRAQLIGAAVLGWLLVTLLPAVEIARGNFPLDFSRFPAGDERPSWFAIFVLVATVSLLFGLIGLAFASRQRRAYFRAQHHNPRAYGFESYRGPDGRFRSVYKSYADDKVVCTPLSDAERAWSWVSTFAAYIAAMFKWMRLSHSPVDAEWLSSLRSRADEFWPSITAVAAFTFLAFWLLGSLVSRLDQARA